MTRQSKIAITTSLALHVIGFIVLAGVKLYTEVSAKDEMSVAFVEVQKTRPLRRSAHVRPMASFKESPQNHQQEQAIIRPAHQSTVVFYTDAPEKVFSAVKGVKNKGLKQMGIVHRPSAANRRYAVNPTMTGDLRETRLSGIQTQDVSSGIDFLSEIKPVRIEASLGDILNGFAERVRRKIESKKRYPLAAQRAVVEGSVGVKMTILKDGCLEQVDIAESSGHEILDRAALRSVRRASPFPPIPEDAKRDKVQMSIYLVFEIT